MEHFTRTYGSVASQKIDLNACIGGELEEDARELLKSATRHRDALCDALDYAEKTSTNADPRAVVSAVDAYLVELWRLTASMQASASAKIKMRKKLEFKWRSMLLVKNAKFSFPVLIFEVIYICMLKGLAHYDSARLSMQAKKDNWAIASTELRKGAGLFELVSSKLLPGWTGIPTQDKLPALCTAPVASSLASAWLATAQRLACHKAVVEGKTPPGLISKLLTGCVRKYELAKKVWLSLTPEAGAKVSPVLLEEFNAYCPYMAALSYYYLGISLWKKDQYGDGIACLRKAVGILATINVSAYYEKDLSPFINKHRVEIETKLAEYETENNGAYFASIPADCPSLPDPVYVAKSIPYQLDESEDDLVSFAEQVKVEELEAVVKKKSGGGGGGGGQSGVKALLSSWFGGGGSGGDDEEAVAEATDVPDGVDPEVFVNLPPEIQAEIRANPPSSDKATFL